MNVDILYLEPHDPCCILLFLPIAWSVARLVLLFPCPFGALLSLSLVGLEQTPDLLLLLWPVFFVFAVPQEPEYKARNFRKTANKGTRLIRSVTSSVGFSAPHEQRLPTRGSNASLQSSRSVVSPSASLTSGGSTIGSNKVRRRYRQTRTIPRLPVCCSQYSHI